MDVRLDLLELVHHLEDAVLGLEDVVAVEERLRRDLEQERVGRVAEDARSSFHLRVPERRPRVGALHMVGVGDDRDVPREAAHARHVVLVVGPAVTLGEVRRRRDVGGLVSREDVAVDRALQARPRASRRRPAPPAAIACWSCTTHTSDVGWDTDSTSTPNSSVKAGYISRVLLEEAAVGPHLDRGPLDVRGVSASGSSPSPAAPARWAHAARIAGIPTAARPGAHPASGGRVARSSGNVCSPRIRSMSMTHLRSRTVPRRLPVSRKRPQADHVRCDRLRRKEPEGRQR